MLTKIWTTTLMFLAWLCFCAWLVLVCHEKNLQPLRDFFSFFKKQSNVGRVLFGVFVIVMWIYASVKPGGEGNGEQGTGNGDGTNNVQMVVGPGGGLQPLVTPGAVTNNQQQGFQGGIQRQRYLCVDGINLWLCSVFMASSGTLERTCCCKCAWGYNMVWLEHRGKLAWRQQDIRV